MGVFIKRTVSVILTAAVLWMLYACEKAGVKTKTAPEIADAMYADLAAYYTGRKLTDYKEAAALCEAGFDFTRCDWSGLTETPSSGLKSFTGYLISVYILDKAGCDVAACDTERYLGYLGDYLGEADKVSTIELSEIIIALTLYERDFDMTAAADSLLSRQDEVTGAFYDYPLLGGEKAAANPEAAAFALMAYQTIRPAVSSPKYNDTVNDGAMIYLFYQINDDNSVNDGNGKASASATALCLTSLLSAGMTAEGDNALCLVSALSSFLISDGGRFGGYREYLTDKTASAEATAFVLLCAITVRHGNPLTEKKAVGSSDVSE